MPNAISHFAINADDVPRARRFYETVFGWKFTSWGPPGFFQIDTGGAKATAIKGALQQRRELVPGAKMLGFECTIGVDDLDAVKSAIEAAGGAIVMAPVTIAGVGTLLFFRDTEGNLAGAMRYDPDAK
jgi:predicted enzyme related to lactoylglutathione lyase